jgi:gluconolactonase
MRRLLPLLVACDGSSTLDAAPADVVQIVNPLVDAGDVELVDGGYQFTEGPQWRDAEGDLVFTDIPANTIFRYVPGGSAPVSLRMPSEMANGLAIAPDGALWAAEHGSRTVTRDAVAMASMFEGSRLNSPNDVVIATDGTAYFTDPPFGIGDQPDELTFMGVFRLSGTTLTAEHRGGLTERPNGIGLSPDGARLYVAYSNDGVVYRFGIQADGSLGPREPHATTSGGADGLALDGAGNVFVTSSSGVEVFAPDGSKWGTIAVPEQPANCAFGDTDHKTLYITARTSLYRVRLAAAGEPTR